MANTFTRTRDSIINAALRKLGVIAQGDLPDPEQVVEAAEALEDLLKHLQASTELRWNLVQRTQAITAGTATYTLTSSTDVIDIYNLYLQDVNTGNFPVRLVDQNFFDQNYNNTSTSNTVPTCAVAQFDRSALGVPSVKIVLYPNPPVNYTLYYRALVKQQNAGVGTDNLNLDELWMRVLKYGLACDLADEYVINIERTQRLEAKYAQLLEEAQRKSRNTKDTFFVYPL